jgi:hypothetical protein
MRNPILAGLAAVACVVAPATAQVPTARPQPTQEQLVALRAAKLAKPVFQKADWLFDYDAARQRAKDEDKLIFVYFTRSYSG